MQARPNPREVAARTGDLPDDAIVHDPVAAILLGMSQRSLQRTNPVPQRVITEKIRGRRLGDIRALIRGTAAA